MAMSWLSLRGGWRIGIAGALLLLAIIVALRLFAITSIARGMVEARIEATSVRGQTIEIDGFRGDLLGNMSIASLEISDADGTWLTASDLDLGWRPFAYFNGHLHLTEVSAESINITRRPITTPSRGGSGGVARYTLETLEMPNISIASGVAGPAQSYMATGAVRATRTNGEVQFNLTTPHQRGDEVYANLAWGGPIPLNGTLSLSGEPNGLIASFLRTPSDASVTLNLDSSAQQNSWKLRADGSVAGVQKLAIDLAISDQTYRAEGSVALDAAGILSPLRARLGDRLDFSAYVDDDDTLEASVKADSFSAELSGVARPSLQGVSIDAMSASIENLDAARVSGARSLSLAKIKAEGDLSISSGTIAFDGTIRTPKLGYADYTFNALKADGDWALSPTSIASEMRIEANAVTGLPRALGMMAEGPVSARFSGAYDRATEQLRARTLLLESGSLWALGNGSAARNGAVNLSGEARLTNSKSISSLQTKWSLSGGSLNALQLKLGGTAELSDRSGALVDLVGEVLDFDVIARRAQNNFVLQSAKIVSDNLQANVSGALRQDLLDFQGNLELSTLKVPQVTAETISTDFVITGAISAPRLVAETQARDIQIAGQTLLSPNVSTQVLLGGDTAFEILADAEFLDSPLQLNLQGRRFGERIDIETLSSDWSNLVAKGIATIDTREPQSSRVALDISGTTPLGGVVVANLDYAAGLLDADVAVSDLEIGAMVLSQSRAQMRGNWPAFDGNLSYQAQVPVLGTPQRIVGSHRLIGEAEEKRLTITGTSDIAGQTLTVSSPIEVVFDQSLFLQGAVDAFGGRAEVNLDASGQSPSAIEFNGIQMATIGPLLNRPSLSGTLNGALQIGLTDDVLTGEGAARLTELTRIGIGSASTDLVLDVSVEDNQLSANLETQDSDDTLNFAVTASTALKHNGTLLSIRRADDGLVPVALSGTGAIDSIWALVAPTNLRLAGDLLVDINNGSGDSWRFEGPMALSNATFEDGLTGLHLKDISADAILRPDGIEVQSARASGRRSGYVEAAGLYHFDGAGSVGITLNRLNAFSRSDVSATVSGTAEIERQNRRTQITGDLDIDEARVNLEQLPGAGYTTLDVVFDDTPEADRDTTPEREAIELNFNIDADRRIFVTGSGVDTEWGLDARVTGPAGRPSVIGRATLIRGEADLLSRRFRFSDGTVQFVGDPLDSDINIRAERTDDEVTASITLSGSIDDPEIELSSVPSLPDDEILSRVLFGRSPSELSALEAAQLAGAAAQLAGGEAFNLMGQLQEATGLDRLDIAMNDEGAATVSTGKYIAKDIYLEIETGGTGAPGVALEWTPLDNVAVDAEIDPELGPKVSVQWKRDFDRLPGESDDD